MLRSNANLVAVRLALYGLAALCVSLFGWGLFHVVRVASESPDRVVRVVLGLCAFIMVGLLAAAVIGASRSSHPGGHFLVSMAALFGAFLSFVGLLMVAF